MKIKALTLALLTCIGVNSYAFDLNIKEHFAQNNTAINTIEFKNSENIEHQQFCEQYTTPVCKGKDCETEKRIQAHLHSSCMLTANDRISLLEPPVGPVGFIPASYLGFSVYLSRMKNLIVENPGINQEQFLQYNDWLSKTHHLYRQFDDVNIRTTFMPTGKYLETKRNVKKANYKKIHSWAEDVMQERKFIDNQFSSLKKALEDPVKLSVFKVVHSNLMPSLTAERAFTTFKDANFSNQQCEVIFMNLRESYISDLHKHTHFKCENPEHFFIKVPLDLKNTPETKVK